MSTNTEIVNSPKKVKKNFIALLIDVTFYWLGAAFTDPMTVLLVMMKYLGATPILLGTTIALRFLAQYGVQVFVSYFLYEKTRNKKFLCLTVGLSRIPLIFLPFIIYHAHFHPEFLPVALWSTIILLTLVGLGEGFGGVPWSIIVGRAFTIKTRGRFFATTQISAGVLTILIAVLFVTPVLNLPRPTNFVILVAMSALMFQISTIGLLLISEPDVPPSLRPKSPRPPLKKYLSRLPAMIRKDKTFARLVIIQLFINAGWAPMPYYVDHARTVWKLNDDWAGSYQMLQAISVALLMPLWTYLSEKRSPATAVRGVAFVCLMTPIVVLSIGSISQWHYGTLFLLTGGSLTAGGIWVVINHFLLSHTNDEDRPHVVAMLNLLNVPCAVFPLLGSLLVRDGKFIMVSGFPVLLVITACFLAVGFYLSLRLSSADDKELLEGHTVNLPNGEDNVAAPPIETPTPENLTLDSGHDDASNKVLLTQKKDDENRQ